MERMKEGLLAEMEKRWEIRDALRSSLWSRRLDVESSLNEQIDSLRTK